MAVTIVENPTDAAQQQRKYTININNTHLIHTTVTSSGYIVQNWIRDIIFLFYRDQRLSHLVVGIGVQWTRFTPLLGRRPAATLQLCVGCHCLVYQLLHSINVPRILRAILSVYPSITFVCVGSPCSYSQRLHDSHHSLLLSPNNMPIDLRLRVFGHRHRRSRPCGFHEIAQRFLGLLYNQFDIMVGWNSDWEVQNLSPEQVSFASLLPFLSFITGIRIRAWRFNPNLYRVNHNDDNVDDR